MTPVRSFEFCTRGNVAIFTGAILPVAVLFCGLVLDQGTMNVQQRKLQNAVDMAAISGASTLAQAERVALATLADNGVMLSLLEGPVRDGESEKKIAARATVEKGRYLEDGSLPLAERFSPGRQPYNAVRVSVDDTMSAPFNPLGRKPQPVSKSATAAIRPAVTYSLGSRLLSLDEGIANEVLSALTGSDVELTVMDYTALAGADIALLGFLEALAVQADLAAVTYNDVLESNVSKQHVFKAMEAVSSDSARTALSKLAQDVAGSTRTVKPGHIIDLGPLGARPLGSGGLAADIGVMDLVSASAMAANGSRQVEADLETDLPGLADVDLAIAIGGSPESGSWLSLGPSGTMVRTAQTRLKLSVTIGDDALPDGGLITLPLYIELAGAEAGVSSARCAYRDPARSSATIAARPGIAQAWIGTIRDDDFADFSTSLSPSGATLLELSLARVTANAYASMRNSQPQALYFSASDISRGNLKTARTYQYTNILVHSLLDNLDVDVETLGLGLSVPGGITAIVTEVLEEATPSIDLLLHQVLRTLGVGLGEADVRVHAVHCTLAELVQ